MRTKKTIGIDMGATYIRGAIVDRTGKIQSCLEVSTPTKGDPDAILDVLAEIVNVLSSKEPDGIQAVGIGLPGPLNSKSGIVTMMPNVKGLENYPIKEKIEARVNLPVRIINDADAAAIGEYLCGAAKGLELFVMLTLGTGLGSSIMVNGCPWLGRDGYSAELGHIPLFDADQKCECGGWGHAEAALSIKGLRRDYQHRIGKKTLTAAEFSVKHLFESARNGDTIAAGVADRYGKALGRVIATVAATLNLHHCIIGGGISAAWDILEEPVQRSIRQFGFAPLTKSLLIKPGVLGNDAAVIGAGLMMTAGTLSAFK